jgi:hypothetical protein
MRQRHDNVLLMLPLHQNLADCSRSSLEIFCAATCNQSEMLEDVCQESIRHSRVRLTFRYSYLPEIFCLAFPQIVFPDTLRCVHGDFLRHRRPCYLLVNVLCNQTSARRNRLLLRDLTPRRSPARTLRKPTRHTSRTPLSRVLRARTANIRFFVTIPVRQVSSAVACNHGSLPLPHPEHTKGDFTIPNTFRRRV